MDYLMFSQYQNMDISRIFNYLCTHEAERTRMRQKDGFSGERSIVLPPMIVDMEREDPLVSSLYLTDIGYYPHAAGHFRERTEPISQNVLIYCADGAGWYRTGGREYAVAANQFFIIPAGEPHSYGASGDNPWTIYWVHFTGSQSAIYAQGAGSPQDVRPGVHSRINYRNNIFEEIFNTLNAGYSLDSLRYVSSMLHYYLASMRYLSTFRSAGRRIDDNVVDAAIHYMKENMEKRLTLDGIAEYTGYSASHFSALFRQQTGQSPLGYLNGMKMEEACRMLAETSMRINQICHKVGIDDCYYFSRMFSRIIGMSPKEYRKRHNVV